MFLVKVCVFLGDNYHYTCEYVQELCMTANFAPNLAKLQILSQWAIQWTFRGGITLSKKNHVEKSFKNIYFQRLMS